jgi:hypothetical protein
MSDPVECRSEVTYAERPTAFTWEGARRTVHTLVGSWRIPQGWRFLVRTQDGQHFELLFDESADQWNVAPSPFNL